jgi:hypothetical protein
MFDPMKIHETDTFGNLKRAHAIELAEANKRVRWWRNVSIFLAVTLLMGKAVRFAAAYGYL